MVLEESAMLLAHAVISTVNSTEQVRPRTQLSLRNYVIKNSRVTAINTGAVRNNQVTENYTTGYQHIMTFN